MPRLLVFFALVCLLPLTALAQAPDMALRAAEERLATALSQKDEATLDGLLAPTFVLRGVPDTPRATWMTNALTLCWGDRYDISDFSVTSGAGHTAIVSLLLTTYRDPMTCDAAVVRSLLTDVWTYTDGRWQLALRHAAPPPRGVAGQFAKTTPPPPRWERSAEVSLVATGGNTDTQTLGAGLGIIWRPGAWTTRSRAKFVRSATADAVTAESLVAELRQSRTLSSNADVFARAEYLVDRFAGLSDRTSVEGGFGWTILQGKPHSLKFDGGAGVTHESRLKGANVTFVSATVTSAYQWQITSSASAGDQMTISTGVAEPANWRLHNVVQLTLSMSRLLSVRMSHELKHVARPVPGFRPTDTIISMALVGRF